MASTKINYDVEYDTDYLGGAGEDYSRLIAIRLLTLATMAKIPFKLAIEMTAAGKFDDVAFYNETTNEWWLFQAKHSADAKELTWEAMFPAKPSAGDFAMAKYFKSYLGMKRDQQFAGKNVKPFLFTNRPLKKLKKGQNAKVSKVGVQASTGEHLPDNKSLEKLKKEQYTTDSEANVQAFIGEHSLSNRQPEKMAKERNATNAEVDEMLKLTIGEHFRLEPNQEDIRVISSHTKYGDELHQPQIDDSTVEAFFRDLVISVSQPNVESLAEEIQREWIRWMKGCIRPDVFRRLTEDQLLEPFNTFKKYFKEWEGEYDKDKTRRYLTLVDGIEYMKTVCEKLSKYVEQGDRRIFVGLDAAEKYYVNRMITFEHRSETLNDKEFVERLCENWNDEQRFVLFGEPGMGKSTLWQHLAFKAQQKYPAVEVFLIYLNDFNEVLRRKTEMENLQEKKKEEGKELTSAVEIMEAVISKKNCEPLLDKQQKVLMFMDAFDEVDETSQQTILNILLVLSEQKNVKLVICSRERCRKVLEESLEGVPIKVMPFNAADRCNFLRLFWGVSDSEEDTKKFDSFCTELFQRLDRDLPRGDVEFIGLPLTIRMLAEIFKSTFEEFLTNPPGTKPDSVLPEETLSIVFLYEQFTTKCIKLTLNKVWELNINRPTFDKTFKPKIESADENYQLFAMKELKFNLVENHESKFDKFLEYIQEGIEESLLLETANGTVRFTHRSYTEYFCAKYMFSKLKIRVINVEYWKDIFKSQEVIRKFIFKMIDAKMTTAPNEIQNHLEFLKTIGEMSEIWASTDNCVNLLSNTTNLRKVREINQTRSTLLHEAARSNAHESVQLLLRSVPIDIENDNKDTPLGVACSVGHLQMVKLLVSLRAKVNHRIGLEEAPLNIAASRGHLAIIEHLINNGATVNPDPGSSTHFPLYCAANLDVVRLLLQKGGTVDWRNSSGETALFRAAFKGFTEVVKELLLCEADPNARDREGRTPLFGACRRGHFDVIQLLISKGSLLNITNFKGKTVLHNAVDSSQADTVKKLLEIGANIDAQDNEKKTALHLAAYNNSPEIVHILMENRADFRILDSKGRSALHEAVYECYKNATEKLLEYEVEINQQDNEGNTPLHIASMGTRLTRMNYAQTTRFVDIVRLYTAKNARTDLVNSKKRTALHGAALSGLRGVVEALLECNANVDVQDVDRNSPLHYAVQRGNAQNVSLLLEKGANVDLMNSRKQTALHVATLRKRVQIVEQLLQFKANVSLQDDEGKTALDIAYSKGYSDIMILLIKAGNVSDQQKSLRFAVSAGFLRAVQETPMSDCDINEPDEHGKILLHIASSGGYPEIVRVLIGRRADVNQVDSENQTALHKAAASGKASVVEELLNHKAHVNMHDNNGRTSLHLASERGHLDVVRILIGADEATLHEACKAAISEESCELYADINAQDHEGCTPLHFASKGGCSDTVQFLIEKGALVDAVDSKGRTALHEATCRGHASTVDELLRSNANLNAQDNTGLTPLHIAGYEDIVRALIRKGATVDLADSQGRTALHKALHGGHRTDTAGVLLQGKANINAQDKEGNTPLHVACMDYNHSAVSSLLQRNANVNAVNFKMQTALHITALTKKINAMRELLQHAASVNEHDDEGNTPLHIAIMLGHSEIVQVLMNEGARVDRVNLRKQTGLHLAAFYNRKTIVDYLIKSNTHETINAKDDEGNTPPVIAFYRGHLDVTRVLITAGAVVDPSTLDAHKQLHFAAFAGLFPFLEAKLKTDININDQDDHGRTPLHYASMQDNLEIVKLLLEKGARTDLDDSNQRTALDVATSYGKTAVVEELTKCGAISKCRNKTNPETALRLWRPC